MAPSCLELIIFQVNLQERTSGLHRLHGMLVHMIAGQALLQLSAADTDAQGASTGLFVTWVGS